ncbi:unnamed protein product [Cylicocyclus nassatus]|uniref:Uncharacterized protein n=1 Tax=Cylicocyclus nassatus TaxID=53992 RepID=A0AA36GGY6_CYLNA|nr:unnamed protein product [Cylicocyclus nassatus]
MIGVIGPAKVALLLEKELTTFPSSSSSWTTWKIFLQYSIVYNLKPEPPHFPKNFSRDWHVSFCEFFSEVIVVVCFVKSNDWRIMNSYTHSFLP